MSENTTETGETVSKDDGVHPTVQELQEQIAKLQGENAKLNNIKKTLSAERDALKQAKQDTTQQDYKQLWEEQQAKATKVLEKVKNSEINAALSAQLQKAKVSDQFAAAALKLVNRDLVEWDEDTGLNEQSVTAAVQKLKSEFSAMFETKVPSVSIKEPAGGNTTDKTITRAEFDKLSPSDRHELIVTKDFKVV